MNKNYSDDQMVLVRLINSNSLNDCYWILGLDKNRCSVADIRKAYKNMCLRVHPDKNNAPGSEDAFKKVDDAYHELLRRHQHHHHHTSSSSSNSNSNSYSYSPEAETSCPNDYRVVRIIMVFGWTIVLAYALINKH